MIKNNSTKNQKLEYLEIGCNAGGTLVRILDKITEDNFDIHLTGVDLFEDIMEDDDDATMQTHIHDELNMNTVPIEILTNLMLDKCPDLAHQSALDVALDSENYPKYHKNQNFL